MYKMDPLHLIENVIPLTPTVTRTLKQNNVFILTKSCYFSSKCKTPYKVGATAAHY